MARPVVAGIATFAPAANTAGTASPLVITTPTGAAALEALFAALVCQTQTAADFGLPDVSWLRRGLTAVNNADVRVTGLFATELAATPAASYSFTTPAASARIGGVLARVQNWSGSVVTPSGYGTRVTSTITTTTHAVPEDDCLRFELFHVVGTVGNALTVLTPPAGMTLVGSVISGLNAGSRDAAYLYQQDVDTGTAPTKTAVFNGTLAAGASNGLILLGEPDPPVRTYPAPFTIIGGERFYGRLATSDAVLARAARVPTGVGRRCLASR